MIRDTLAFVLLLALIVIWSDPQGTGARLNTFWTALTKQHKDTTP